jgi:hypothetical protein
MKTNRRKFFTGSLLGLFAPKKPQPPPPKEKIIMIRYTLGASGEGVTRKVEGVPEAFTHAMDDFRKGRVVDLDTALFKEPPKA